jgi:hypothetical protein
MAEDRLVEDRVVEDGWLRADGASLFVCILLVLIRADWWFKNWGKVGRMNE